MAEAIDKDAPDVFERVRNEWLETAEGQRCSDPYFLNSRYDQPDLIARLSLAFAAGVRATERAIASGGAK